MKLKYVTLTGADDSVEPKDLIALSEKYTFAEWAILFSQKKSGQPRYPTWDWVKRLSGHKFAERDWMNLSAHLCGKWCDDALKGNITFLATDDMSRTFGRVQLNMGRERLQTAIKCEQLFDACHRVEQPVIFGGNYQHIEVNGDFFITNGLLPLFDASGGRGVETRDWPKPYKTTWGTVPMTGYAGGLGPDNVVREIERIAEVVDPVSDNTEIWVDMETKLRSKVGGKDVFDLEKCEQVLQAMKPWVDN